MTCKHCGAPVNLAPDGDPRYERPYIDRICERAMSWADIKGANKDGTLYLLKVEGGDFPMSDSSQFVTIGFNNLEKDGEDKWRFAGWCWSHDEFREGNGKVISFRRIEL